MTASYPTVEPPADISDAFPLLEAANQLPRRNGKKISKATLYRLARQGRIKTFRVADSLFTNQRFLDEFLGRRSDPNSREARLASANRRCEAQGI